MAGVTPAPARSERVVATIAAAVLVVLYVVLVSRGEALPYEGPARSLTAPLLALTAVGLIGWRLRRLLVAAWHAPAVRWGALAVAGLALATGLRLLVGPLDRPAAPAEAAIVAGALAIIREEPPRLAEPVALALAWLHSPLAAYRYVAGVSAGLWEGIKFVTVDATLPVSRALHLGLSLATVVVTGLAGHRLAGPVAGWLAAALLALSGPAVVAATTLDAGAPAGLLIAGTLLGLANLAARRAWVIGPRRTGPALVVLALVGVGGLWLPGPFGAALAPVAAVVAAVALAALLRAWRARGQHAAAP